MRMDLVSYALSLREDRIALPASQQDSGVMTIKPRARDSTYNDNDKEPSSVTHWHTNESLRRRGDARRVLTDVYAPCVEPRRNLDEIQGGNRADDTRPWTIHVMRACLLQQVFSFSVEASIYKCSAHTVTKTLTWGTSCSLAQLKPDLTKPNVHPNSCVSIAGEPRFGVNIEQAHHTDSVNALGLS